MKHCKYLSLKFVLINGKKTNLVRSLRQSQKNYTDDCKNERRNDERPFVSLSSSQPAFRCCDRAWAERSGNNVTLTQRQATVRLFAPTSSFLSSSGAGFPLTRSFELELFEYRTVRTCTCPTVYVTVACDLIFWHTILPGNKPHAQDRRDAHYESGVLFGFTLFSNGTSENTENERGTRDSGGSYKAIGWAARNTRGLLNQSQEALYVFHWSSTETSHCSLDHKNWWLLAFTDRLLILRSLTLSVNQIKKTSNGKIMSCLFPVRNQLLVSWKNCISGNFDTIYVTITSDCRVGGCILT